MSSDAPPPRPPKPVSARPRNVRDGLGGEAEAPEIPVESREVESEGVVWTVESTGRARVRTGGAGTPILDLRFRAEGRGTLRGLAVGRRLEELSEDQLLEALRAARPPEGDARKRGFFEGTDQAGRRSKR